MRYIINKLKSFFSLKKLIIFCLIIYCVFFLLNTYILKENIIEASIKDNDNTLLSKQFVKNSVTIPGFKKYQKGDSNVYVIKKGFEEKIYSHNYKDLIENKDANIVEVEKLNLKIMELIIQKDVIKKINRDIELYDVDKYINDLNKAKDDRLVDIVDISKNKNGMVRDTKKEVILLIYLLFILLSILFINIEIVNEKNSLILERLLLCGVSRRYYFLEKFIKLLLINILFVIVSNNINFVNYRYLFSLIIMFIYSMILQIFDFDRNTYIISYVVLVIIFAIFYLVPNMGLSYISPIEILIGI